MNEFYTPLDDALLADLKDRFSSMQVLTEPQALRQYGHDETEDLLFMPGAVLMPLCTEDVAGIVKWCQLHHVPLTARGAGTGLSGGALPVYGGIVLSLEKMNRIIEIDERNLQVRVEPGVITEVLMQAVEERSLYYPVDPSSKGSCFLGGNVAHGSGGPRVVKYGTIREYVLNLQVVLASGEVIWTGADTLKYASGYNLTQLMIGSEGTLGIVTCIVLKLIPRPGDSILLMAEFEDAEQACEAVSAIFKAGFTPSALEFMEREGVEWVVKHEQIQFELKNAVNAYLMVELDGNEHEHLLKESESLAEVLYAARSTDIMLAETAAEKEGWWRMRRKMADSVKAHSIYKEEDTVVPRAELAKLLKGIKEIGKKYRFSSVCYGHAGDGNLHVNIIKGEMSDQEWEVNLLPGIQKIFELTVSLGGTLSGEHGIGWVQKQYMPIKYPKQNLDLMRLIKKAFDPTGILNPGKIFEA